MSIEKELTPIVKKELERKAEMLGITLDEYLKHTDNNFCICTSDGYLLADDGGVVVYGSVMGANNDCHSGDIIVSETTAIRQMCNEERKGMTYDA